MNLWRWEVYMLDEDSDKVHVFTSTQSFATIVAAEMNLMWHINGGILEKDFPLDTFTLIDVVYHLEKGGDVV